MIVMPQIFDGIANENSRYKNELKYTSNANKMRQNTKN